VEEDEDEEETVRTVKKQSEMLFVRGKCAKWYTYITVVTG